MRTSSLILGAAAFVVGLGVLLWVLPPGGKGGAGETGSAGGEVAAGSQSPPGSTGWDPAVFPEPHRQVLAAIEGGGLREAEKRLRALGQEGGPDALALEALLLMRRGYYRTALQRLEEARARYPRHPRLRDLWIEAALLVQPERVVETRGDREPPGSPLVFEARFLKALKEGDRREIARVATEARAALSRPAALPGAGDNLALLGAISLAVGEWDRALQELQRALEAGIPNLDRAQDVRMAAFYACLRRNDLEQARRYLDEAARVLRENADRVDSIAAQGLWEQILTYRLVYYGELASEEEVDLLEPVLKRMLAEGLRPELNGFEDHRRLGAVFSALRRGDSAGALEAWEGEEGDEPVELEEITCVFHEVVHRKLMDHADILLSADLHRAVGDREGAAQLCRDALAIFPESRAARERLEALENS